MSSKRRRLSPNSKSGVVVDEFVRSPSNDAMDELTDMEDTQTEVFDAEWEVFKRDVRGALRMETWDERPLKVSFVSGADQVAYHVLEETGECSSLYVMVTCIAKAGWGKEWDLIFKHNCDLIRKQNYDANFQIESKIVMLAERFVYRVAMAAVRRDKEKRFLEGFNRRAVFLEVRLSGKTFSLSYDIAQVIVSFIPHDYALITGLGLCNSSCNQLVMCSWRELSVHTPGIMRIPLCVTRGARHLTVCTNNIMVTKNNHFSTIGSWGVLLEAVSRTLLRTLTLTDLTKGKSSVLKAMFLYARSEGPFPSLTEIRFEYIVPQRNGKIVDYYTDSKRLGSIDVVAPQLTSAVGLPWCVLRKGGVLNKLQKIGFILQGTASESACFDQLALLGPVTEEVEFCCMRRNVGHVNYIPPLRDNKRHNESGRMIGLHAILRAKTVRIRTVVPRHSLRMGWVTLDISKMSRCEVLETFACNLIRITGDVTKNTCPRTYRGNDTYIVHHLQHLNSVYLESISPLAIGDVFQFASSSLRFGGKLTYKTNYTTDTVLTLSVRPPGNDATEARKRTPGVEVRPTGIFLGDIATEPPYPNYRGNLTVDVRATPGRTDGLMKFEHQTLQGPAVRSPVLLSLRNVIRMGTFNTATFTSGEGMYSWWMDVALELCQTGAMAPSGVAGQHETYIVFDPIQIHHPSTEGDRELDEDTSSGEDTSSDTEVMLSGTVKDMDHWCDVINGIPSGRDVRVEKSLLRDHKRAVRAGAIEIARLRSWNLAGLHIASLRYVRPPEVASKAGDLGGFGD